MLIRVLTWKIQDHFQIGGKEKREMLEKGNVKERKGNVNEPLYLIIVFRAIYIYV